MTTTKKPGHSEPHVDSAEGNRTTSAKHENIVRLILANRRSGIFNFFFFFRKGLHMDANTMINVIMYNYRNNSIHTYSKLFYQHS